MKKHLIKKRTYFLTISFFLWLGTISFASPIFNMSSPNFLPVHWWHLFSFEQVPSIFEDSFTVLTADGSDGSDGATGAKGDKGDKGDAGDSFDSSDFFFYPPSVSLDVSTAGASHSYDLYALYVDNFSFPSATASGAPTSINVFDRTALNYFVTDYDTSVFENLSISSGGELAYRVKATPTNDNTIINIVFVVK
ncbi:MAG: hypothetical protein P8N20_04050 [Flavobacteriaceae bacterium]|nr:hypothetical protein [Flavobacteriaceae bacterium]MDG1774489.1 hypothetical protein [Flavobacteriaceae bacterium]MDG2415996.1 hypothetical protein [Flavobacteriaceae bacterium]